MDQTSKKPGRLRQMRVVAIRPRGSPREQPPPPPARVEEQERSAFPEVPVPFASLDLPVPILKSLEAMGYGQATEVQARAVPLARAGRDLIVESRTGTGKTTAFGIPLVETIDAGRPQVQALVLCPTRELSVQVADELGRLGQLSDVKVLAIYGGDSMARQIDGLKRGAHVVVGTPGRILDLLGQKVLRLNAVRFLVLDEADRMLDMGFEREVKQILDQVPKDRQTLMFSATIPSAIEAIASKYQRDPERLMLSQDALYVTGVQHLVATDVAARGIDIEDLSHVFIYSTPDSSDQYIHRAGRTGRIGKTGRVISLVSAFDLMNFNRLVRANHLKAYEIDVPSDEEVARRKVRRIVDTLKEQAARLTEEERAEYEAMAQGILDDADRLAIVGYLLKTHFEEEAARSVLDETAAAGDAETDTAPRAAAGGGGHESGRAPYHASRPGQGHAVPGGDQGPPGSGRRRRRRRRRGGQGGGSHGGHGGGHGPAGGSGSDAA